MISRYSCEEIKKVWSDVNRFSIWLKIEILCCEFFTQQGLMEASDLENIKSKARFDVQEVLDIEKTVHHDVIAFLTNVNQNIGQSSRFMHFGLTSSDILDTSFAVQLVESGTIILEKLKSVSQSLLKKACSSKGMVVMGRSHGIHAEPTTMGLKFLVFYDEIVRQISFFEQALDAVRVGMISGPVGTYSCVDPEVELYVCQHLGLHPASISTQIISRDRHAHLFNSIAVIGACIEKIALEVRSLQRTEVREVEELFSSGQKGSSAMPHKRNPIISERLCGQARLLRSYALSAIENVALWHERDISHSSVERVIAPDAFSLLGYMLDKLVHLVDHLVLYPDNMKKNVEMSRDLYFSQSLMLVLVKKGKTREEAYACVQRNAMIVWDQGKDFLDQVLKDEEISSCLTNGEVRSIFSIGNLLSHEDTIFGRFSS